MLKNYIGTNDYLPDEWKLIQYIFNNWRRVTKAHGFQEYDLPVLANLKLFTDKSGEEIKTRGVRKRGRQENHFVFSNIILDQLAVHNA
jgi:histidyl-tRNA synthetase